MAMVEGLTQPCNQVCIQPLFETAILYVLHQVYQGESILSLNCDMGIARSPANVCAILSVQFSWNLQVFTLIAVHPAPYLKIRATHHFS